MRIGKHYDRGHAYVLWNTGEITREHSSYLKVIDDVRCRVNTLVDIPIKSKMYYGEISHTKNNINLLKNETSKILLFQLLKKIKPYSEIDGNSFKQLLIETGDEIGVKGKDLFFPVRIALYGNSKGPDIPLIFSILGMEETLRRLKKYI